ncbi:hypothetical protein Z948_3576 [Sulfitobacter donghicola DSW-25 = KCTC 12864 = JCM 14565]|nr:hypothetical protein Z948_3576 [Sulfitobacter donghicola DSW-25 = KCTC 12864 = JCM 14565]
MAVNAFEWPRQNGDKNKTTPHLLRGCLIFGPCPAAAVVG